MQDDNETEWVLVESLSQFKISYMVEVPKGKAEYALDTVAMEEAEEFTQEHLRPTDIVLGYRVVSKEEALEMFRKVNPYFSGWSDELIMKHHFTPWKK